MKDDTALNAALSLLVACQWAVGQNILLCHKTSFEQSRSQQPIIS